MTATWSFAYRRDRLDGSSDYVTIDVSDNGGGSWTELDRFQGPADDTAYLIAGYDISAYMAVDTRIRFLSSPTLGNNDALNVDNVQIVCA